MSRRETNWWAGSAIGVEDDALYEIGSFATRDEAVRAGLRDTLDGQYFYVIEARLSDMDEDDPDFDPDRGIPFAEVLTPAEKIYVGVTVANRAQVDGEGPK